MPAGSVPAGAINGNHFLLRRPAPMGQGDIFLAIGRLFDIAAQGKTAAGNQGRAGTGSYQRS